MLATLCITIQKIFFLVVLQLAQQLDGDAAAYFVHFNISGIILSSQIEQFIDFVNGQKSLGCDNFILQSSNRGPEQKKVLKVDSKSKKVSKTSDCKASLIPV